MPNKLLQIAIVLPLYLLLSCSSAAASIETEYAGDLPAGRQHDTPPIPDKPVRTPMIFIYDPSEPKPRFKDKHPRIYKAYRGTRHVCILAAPIVHVAGSVAQVVTIFVR